MGGLVEIKQNRFNRKTRERNMALPFLIPAVMLIIFVIDERFFGMIPSDLAAPIGLFGVWVAVLLMLWQESRYIKKMVAVLTEQNNPEEYKKIVDEYGQFRPVYSTRYQRKILIAYLRLYQKDYKGAYQLASEKPFFGVPSYIQELREDILYEAEIGKRPAAGSALGYSDMWLAENPEEKDTVKIAGRAELRSFRRKRPGVFWLCVAFNIALVFAFLILWFFVSFRLGQIDSEGHAKSVFFGIPFFIGMIAAMIIPIGLDYLLSPFFHKRIPDYPEEYLDGKWIAVLIVGGLVVCAICAWIIYRISL